jgi:L-histidine Nalpha-methyltransferase
VDTVKDHAVLQAAYDDALGVTGAFNLNLLRHLNRLLGANFDLRQWQHVGLFNEQQSRIEMHLQARVDVTVRWARDGLKGERRFVAGERIHTESSYKWRAADFEALLLEAGFARVQRWTDAGESFLVMLAVG